MLDVRIRSKHDTTENWNNARGFIPMPGEIIIYDDGNVSLDVNVSPDNETVWLTQNQTAILFDTTQQNISLHIKNILEDCEMDDSVHKESLYTEMKNMESSRHFCGRKMRFQVQFTY